MGPSKILVAKFTSNVICGNLQRWQLLQRKAIKQYNLLSRYASLKNNSDNCTGNTSKFTKSSYAKMLSKLPLYASGEIVRGFGRGSKELGIPTANFSLEVVKSLPESLQTGAYYGWANVDNGEVHKMVMSMGWNPHYNNTEKSVETHMLHNFNCDLYGHILKICIVGYLRPERSFNSLDELIEAIRNDIDKAKKELDSVANQKLREAPFFTEEIKQNGCE